MRHDAKKEVAVAIRHKRARADQLSSSERLRTAVDEITADSSTLTATKKRQKVAELICGVTDTVFPTVTTAEEEDVNMDMF